MYLTKNYKDEPDKKLKLKAMNSRMNYDLKEKMGNYSIKNIRKKSNFKAIYTKRYGREWL